MQPALITSTISNKKAKFGNRTISGIANIKVMTRSITLEMSQIIKTFSDI